MIFREYQKTVDELNVEECQNEINADEKAMETHEQELEELSEKVMLFAGRFFCLFVHSYRSKAYII